MDFEVVSTFEFYLILFFQMNTEAVVQSLTFCDTSTLIEINFASIGRRFRL